MGLVTGADLLLFPRGEEEAALLTKETEGVDPTPLTK